VIVKKKEGQEVDPFKIRELLFKEMGPVWVPEAIIDVDMDSLGVDENLYWQSPENQAWGDTHGTTKESEHDCC